MKRFKLLTASHRDRDGRVYNQGDVVESDVDLVSLFGPQKFEAMGEVHVPPLPKIQKEVPARKSSAPETLPPVDEEDVVEDGDLFDDEEREEPSFENEVTDKFPTAAEKGVRVDKTSKGYLIYDVDDMSVMNKTDKIIRVSDVRAFIDSIELE